MIEISSLGAGSIDDEIRFIEQPHHESNPYIGIVILDA